MLNDLRTEIKLEKAWKVCPLFYNDKCNDFHNCGKLEKCKEALQKIGQEVISLHCSHALTETCNDFSNCGKYKKCDKAMERLSEKAGVYYKEKTLDILFGMKEPEKCGEKVLFRVMVVAMIVLSIIGTYFYLFGNLGGYY